MYLLNSSYIGDGMRAKLRKAAALRAFPKLFYAIEKYHDILVVRAEPEIGNELCRIEGISRIIDLRHEMLFMLELKGTRNTAKNVTLKLNVLNVKIVQMYLNVREFRD